MPQQTESFTIVFSKFYQGFGPFAHGNSLTELGGAGMASVMQNADILDPTHITQGPALSNLTNGTQAGVVSELINFIMDKAVTSDVTYAVGVTKLFKISSTTVASGGTPDWPITITNATDGESCIELRGNLYTFFNKTSGGDISKYDLATTFDHDWGSTVPVGFGALQKAPHPVAKKEDLMVFGNGRYAGVYDDSATTIDLTQWDFGNDAEVADVVFHANNWWIAVNYGVSGTNRNYAEIFLADPAGVSTLLADETGVGPQRIGFLMSINGRIWVAYQDLSFSGGFKIGYILGRQLIPVAHFTGALPGFNQKTLYKNTILFVSSALIWSCGAVIEDLPMQISQLADGGHATVGALAAPFGTPLVASTDGGSNHRLAKFSGFDTACNWKSIVILTTKGKKVAHLDYVVVYTKVLGASARCDLDIEYNQAGSTLSAVIQITGTSARRFVKPLGIGDVEDLRVFLNWANGHASNDCAIRRIEITGHFVDKPGSS